MTSFSDITLDFNNMMADRVGPGGIQVSEIDELIPGLRQIYQGHTDLRRLGQLPFRDLPYQEEQVELILKVARKIREQFESVLLLGTGGSSLGAAFLLQALRPEGDRSPRIEICEDLHPHTWKLMTERLSEKKTFLVVVSKSGKTIETLAAFLFFRKWMIEKVGEETYKKSVLFITDPQKGPLRRIAESEKIETLSVPPGVGGRYSILSTVGLIPTACVGIEIREIMAGARRMDQRCQREDVWMNPAEMSAALHYLLDLKRRKKMRVIMPYDDRLRAYTDWFAQLWAESLGKRFSLKGEEVRAGSTPVKAQGSIDQHSQLQLYLEGSQDKTVTLIAVEQPAVDYRIPQAYENIPEFSLLVNKGTQQLLTIQRRSTEAALSQVGCPNMTIELKSVNPYTIGQLLYLAEVETIFAGTLYNINPFDQPGVELIKNYIRGFLGEPEYRKYRQVVEGNKKDSRYTI